MDKGNYIFKWLSFVLDCSRDVEKVRKEMGCPFQVEIHWEFKLTSPMIR